MWCNSPLSQRNKVTKSSGGRGWVGGVWTKFEKGWGWAKLGVFVKQEV